MLASHECRLSAAAQFGPTESRSQTPARGANLFGVGTGAPRVNAALLSDEGGAIVYVQESKVFQTQGWAR